MFARRSFSDLRGRMLIPSRLLRNGPLSNTIHIPTNCPPSVQKLWMVFHFIRDRRGALHPLLVTSRRNIVGTHQPLSPHLPHKGTHGLPDAFRVFNQPEVLQIGSGLEQFVNSIRCIKVGTEFSSSAVPIPRCLVVSIPCCALFIIYI